jgi:outer membrane protein assembly factor BamB
VKPLRLIACCTLLSGCAALMNSSRPSYHGPIVKPLWHNSSIHVDRTPVIHNGVVYAVAQPWDDRDYRRVFAFDLKTGRQLWASDLAAEKILLATDAFVFVHALGGAGVHILDAGTGRDVSPANRVAFDNAAVLDGVLYSTAGAWVEARSLASTSAKPLWQTNLPMDASRGVEPEIAGGAVYIAEFQKFQLEPRKRQAGAVDALDARTGAVRWHWQPTGKKLDPILYGLAADSTAVYAWLRDESGGPFGTGILVALDAATGKEKWRHVTSMYVNSCPAPLLVSPEAVLVCDYPPGSQSTAYETGFLYQRFNRQSGQKIGESQSGWKYENYVTAGGKLFVADHQIHEVLTENNNNSPDSWVTVVSLETGKELWRSETIELGILTTPAAAEGVVVAGSEIFKWESPLREGKRDLAGLWAWSISQ